MTHYLVCDLDDSLIKTDTLYEQWLILFKTKPLAFLKSFFWLLKGRAYFKHQIALETPFHPEKLLYREEVLNYIQEYKAKKKGQVILASASPQAWTEAVGRHLNVFDLTIGSNHDLNLKGSKKLTSIKKHVGDAAFSYIGDSKADLPIWAHSSEIIAVNPSFDLRGKIQKLDKPTTLIKDKKNQLKLLLKQIRPHQWVKNVLIFLPALAGHKFFEGEILAQCVGGFIGFSLLASFVYVFNDLVDISSDRNHHSKKNRPFASGNLSVKWGIVLLPFLFFGAISIGSLLPAKYLGWLSVYFILNIAYSFYVKQQVVLDIIALSMMYTLRIFAGSGATGVPISEWLLSFSTLFFFSLACIKRHTEIGRSKNKLTLDGRGYRQIDYSLVQSLGVGTGLLSILIILLYLQSKEVRSLYTHPEYLWSLTPILLFWISRIWLLTNRDQVHDDPVVFAVKDKVSWACVGLFALVVTIAI